MTLTQIMQKIKSVFYTKAETDTLLLDKSNTTHNHDSAYLGISDKAESAKSADSVAWSNVSDKPTAVSSFTNDSGYITSAGSCNYANSAGSAQPVFNNGQWYLVGDDVKIGDHNVGGGLGLLGNDANTRLDFCQYDNESNYKSITFDGSTLYLDGNCNYANSAGAVNGNVTCTELTLNGYVCTID